MADEESDPKSVPQNSPLNSDEPFAPPPQKTLTATKLPSRPRKIRRIIARPLSIDGELAAAINYLRSSDPKLAPIIDSHPWPNLEPFLPPFLALSKNILFQQLAFRAGSLIYTRFISLCGGESNVLPDIVLGLSSQQLRKIGVSARKTSYLHDLARKYQTGILSDASILAMDDKTLFTMLTMVNGIGSWSVHMFMIFSLRRPDVLPVHDIGIRRGVQMLNDLDELPRPSQMERLCELWRPYRSVAAWYVWRFVEAKNVSSNASVVVADFESSLQQQQQEQHHLHQQFLDPANAIMNLGACAWGQ